VPRRTFASQKELQDYAEQTRQGLPIRSVAKRQRLLSPPVDDTLGMMRTTTMPAALTGAERAFVTSIPSSTTAGIGTSVQ
jgi:hypothetical protein